MCHIQSQDASQSMTVLIPREETHLSIYTSIITRVLGYFCILLLCFNVEYENNTEKSWPCITHMDRSGARTGFRGERMEAIRLERHIKENRHEQNPGISHVIFVFCNWQDIKIAQGNC